MGVTTQASAPRLISTEVIGLIMSRKRVFTFQNAMCPQPQMLGLREAAAFEARFKSIALSSVELAVLAASRVLEEATPMTIGFLLLIDRPTVARALRRLESFQAVSLVRGSSRRDITVRLMEHGLELVDRGMDAWQAANSARSNTAIAAGTPKQSASSVSSSS